MHNNQVNSSISFNFQPGQCLRPRKLSLTIQLPTCQDHAQGLRSATIVRLKTLCESLKRKQLLHNILGWRIISGCDMTDYQYL